MDHIALPVENMVPAYHFLSVYKVVDVQNVGPPVGAVVVLYALFRPKWPIGHIWKQRHVHQQNQHVRWGKSEDQKKIQTAGYLEIVRGFYYKVNRNPATT